MLLLLQLYDYNTGAQSEVESSILLSVLSSLHDCFIFYFFALLPFSVEYLHLTKAKFNFYHIFLLSCTSDSSNNLSSNKMKSIRDNSIISLPSSPLALGCILQTSFSVKFFQCRKCTDDYSSIL